MVLPEVLGENHFSCLFQLLASTVLGSDPSFKQLPSSLCCHISSHYYAWAPPLFPSWGPQHSLVSSPFAPLQSQQQGTQSSLCLWSFPLLSLIRLTYPRRFIDFKGLHDGTGHAHKILNITSENPGYSPDLKILSHHLWSPFCRIICRFQELRCGHLWGSLFSHYVCQFYNFQNKRKT